MFETLAACCTLPPRSTADVSNLVACHPLLATAAYPEPDSAAAQQAVAEAVRQEKAKEKRRAAELLASAGGDGEAGQGGCRHCYGLWVMGTCSYSMPGTILGRELLEPQHTVYAFAGCCYHSSACPTRHTIRIYSPARQMRTPSATPPTTTMAP